MSSRPSDRRIEVFFMGTSFQRPGLATGAAWLLRSGPCVSGRAFRAAGRAYSPAAGSPPRLRWLPAASPSGSAGCRRLGPRDKLAIRPRPRKPAALKAAHRVAMENALSASRPAAAGAGLAFSAAMLAPALATSLPRSDWLPRDSGTSRSMPATTAKPIGTLIPNAHRQEKDDVRHPPRSGPRAAAAP